MEKPEPEIQSMTPREHIRLRPGMYFGGTDHRALHHLVFEVMDNSIDEVMAGRCTHIWIILKKDSQVCIRDNSPGIRVGKLQSVMTQVGAGDFPDGKTHREIYPYRVAGGLHGVGLSAVNGVSSECVVEVAWDGYLWQQIYREGIPQTDVVRARELASHETTGTKITFKPDFTVLIPNEFNYDTIMERARELSFLLPKLTITVRDERVEPPLENIFIYPNGLVSCVEYLNREKQSLHSVIAGNREVELETETYGRYKVAVDFAIQYTDADEYMMQSYISTVPTPEGGVHVIAALNAIAAAINNFALNNYPVSLKRGEQELALSEIRPGLTIVVSVKHPDPTFVGALAAELRSPDIFGVVSGTIYECLLKQSHDIQSILVEKCVSNRHAKKLHERR